MNEWMHTYEWNASDDMVFIIKKILNSFFSTRFRLALIWFSICVAHLFFVFFLFPIWMNLIAFLLSQDILRIILHHTFISIRYRRIVLLSSFTCLCYIYIVESQLSLRWNRPHVTRIRLHIFFYSLLALFCSFWSREWDIQKCVHAFVAIFVIYLLFCSL